MKRATKTASIVLGCLLLSWVVFAQSCARFITGDREAKNNFAKKGIDLQLRSEIIDGRTIHYAMTGNADKPTLFFIHGSPGSWDAFKTYLKDEDLRANFRLISIDRPGFGQSGYGREMGFDAMREYTQVKSVWINVDAQIPPHYKR